MKERVLYLTKFYLLTVALFLADKVVLMLLNVADNHFAVGDVPDVLRHGLTLDLSTALYFLIIPVLVVAATACFPSVNFRWFLTAWSVVTGVSFSLAFVADAALYPHWGYKLDATCLQYLSTPGDAAASVKPLWLALGAVVLVGLMVLFSWLYIRLIPRFTRLRHRWHMAVLLLLAAPIMFIGIRGGVDKSTTNVGQVYYSQTPFLNHSAVNPVFSFLSSFEGTAKADKQYRFFSDEECDRLLEGVFDTLSVNPDTLLRTRRPNILLVMLESASGQFTKIGGKDYVMPHLDQLTDEGVYFSQCYANSFRTDRATVCIWSGYPSFPTMSLQKVPSKSQTLPGVARTLRGEGYDTKFFYGGDINFTKMKSYLVSTGFERFTWRADFSRSEQRTAQWGVCDSIVFDRVLKEVKSWDASSKRPHLIGFLTLSSHEPWDVPINELEDPVENSFRYLDHCIGRFIGQLRETPQWDNLLVIFIPDHGVNHGGLDETSALKMHIPVLWIGGAVRQPRVVDLHCNQSDQAATLLGQLGLPHGQFTFSRDVLSETYTRPFAYHTFNNGFSVVDSTGFVVYDLTADKTLVGDAPDLVDRGKAILQRSSEDLRQR